MRDRYGEFLPLFLRSFGAYPDALPAYAMIPSIFVLGLNEFAVRLPSAVFGIFTLLVVYFLAKELFDEKTALVSALFLAISPWHVLLGRNASAGYAPFLFFFCSALLFFVKALDRRPNYLILSAILFYLSCLSYFSARIFVPLYMTGIAVIYSKKLWKIKKQAFLTMAIMILIFTPLLLYWISPRGMARAYDVFHHPSPCFIHRYLSYFSPVYLFFQGDSNARHHIVGSGQLNLFELITVPFGIFGLIKKKREVGFLLLWLVFYPIPAALTTASHAVRSAIGAPLFAILSGYGTTVIASLIQSRRIRKQLFFGAVAVISVSVIVLFKMLFMDYPKYVTSEWRFGMREAIGYAENSTYNRVFISSSFDAAAVYVLFYTKYSPLLCQKEIKQNNQDSFGKYHICPVTASLKPKAGDLFIVRTGEENKIPKVNGGWKTVHTISDPLGNEKIKLLAFLVR